MWRSYSTRQAAELVGLSESAIRGCVRSGIIEHVEGEFLRFSFRDLHALRLVGRLIKEGVAPKRVRRQLSALLRSRPEASLSSLRLEVVNRNVVIREGASSWRVQDGQMVMAFVFDPPALTSADARVGHGEGAQISRAELAPVRPLFDKQESFAAMTSGIILEPVTPPNVVELFQRALQLEEDDPQGAVLCYQSFLHRYPDDVDALVNLGRLRAELGDYEQAVELFEMANALNPDDATVQYNLGVVAQDTGKDTEAIAFYKRALEIDPGVCEAHYNLATIYDRVGDTQLAIRHINEFRSRNQGR